MVNRAQSTWRSLIVWRDWSLQEKQRPGKQENENHSAPSSASSLVHYDPSGDNGKRNRSGSLSPKYWRNWGLGFWTRSAGQTRVKVRSRGRNATSTKTTQSQLFIPSLSIPPSPQLSLTKLISRPLVATSAIRNSMEGDMHRNNVPHTFHCAFWQNVMNCVYCPPHLNSEPLVQRLCFMSLSCPAWDTSNGTFMLALLSDWRANYCLHCCCCYYGSYLYKEAIDIVSE